MAFLSLSITASAGSAVNPPLLLPPPSGLSFPIGTAKEVGYIKPHHRSCTVGPDPTDENQSFAVRQGFVLLIPQGCSTLWEGR